ncbi:MAG TPA: hypothetical protein VF384_18565 [Planctomycetota bacterium]
MQERHLTTPAQRPRPGSADPADAEPQGTVTVCSGIYEHRLPIVGVTVGDARVRLRDRLDIGPRAVAVVDGVDVGDDHVLRENEIVTFVQRAGEKGASTSLRIEGDQVLATDRVGSKFGMSVGEFVEALLATSPHRASTMVMPPGCKMLDVGRNTIVAVHETAPRIHSLTWIRSDSPHEYGPRATFRQVRIALPYVVLLVAFQRATGPNWATSPAVAVFFRCEPVTARSDRLLLPALLNCMANDALVSQLCTQGLDPSVAKPGLGEEVLTRGIAGMHAHLFASRFNRHPEASGRPSGFTVTAGTSVDSRLRSIEAWEAATLAEPGFACGARWIDAKRSLGDVIDLLRGSFLRSAVAVESADQVAGVVARFGRPIDNKVAVE